MEDLKERTEVKEITVGELRELYHSGEYDIEIDTPDGFQPITEWFDKGSMPIYEIKTFDGLTTRCAFNHRIETADGLFVKAEDLRIGNTVMTVNGPQNISQVFREGYYQNKNRFDGSIFQEKNFVPHDEFCYDFTVGHPNHRYWGDGFSSHNSGKSYIASANIIKWCQQNDVWPVLVDTENALDKSWLEPLGVDTSEDAMDKFLGATVDDVSKFIGEIIDQYKERNDDRPYAERDKMCIIVDSLGMLITPNQEKQFMEGDQKGDMGIKAKQVTAMLRVLISKIGAQRIGIVLTNHVYNSQDKYTPDQIAGGMMVEFSTSLLIQMNKWMLKEDDDGKETKEITGIRTTVVVRKSRYAKPFEKVKINIPYEYGMDPYSGLFELFEKKGIIQGAGSWFSYTSPATGEIFKHQGKSVKKWKAAMDQIMEEWDEFHEPKDASIGFDETESAKADIQSELKEIDQMIESGQVPLAKEKKKK